MAGSLDFSFKAKMDNTEALAKFRELKTQLTTLRDDIKSAVSEVKIKISTDTASLTQDITQIKTTIRSQIGQVDIDVGVKPDSASITASAASIKNQLKTAVGQITVDLNINANTAAVTSQATTIRASINNALGSAIAIHLGVDLPHLRAQLANARTIVNNFFNTSLGAIRLNLAVTQADLAAARAQISTLTSSGAKLKLSIDIAHLNAQIAHARAMLASLTTGSVHINIDATATSLITALHSLKASVDQLRTTMSAGGGGNGGGNGGGGGGNPTILSGMTGQLAGLMAGYVGLTAVVGGLKKTIGSQREFDIFNAQLETATKSSEGATVAFEALQEFAKKTPYDLKQAVDGFTKLVNLGLTPSERALTSYGNTSAALGKDLMQMIEAVADASTGEFERLKEFGIKAKQEGDKVSLTFQGVTKTIGNNAAEIEEYLLKIGENEFAGAMAKRVDTLDGAIASLSDTWDALFRAVSDLGVGDAIKDAVHTAEDSINDLITLLESGAVEAALDGMASAFSIFGNDAKSDMQGMATAFSGLGEFMVSSWRSTISELNTIGNIWTRIKAGGQLVGNAVSSGYQIVADPFNRKSSNKEKQQAYENRKNQIVDQAINNEDAVQKGYNQAELLRLYQRQQAELDKANKTNEDRLAKFKIPSKGTPATSKSGDDKKKDKDAEREKEKAEREAEALARAKYDNVKAQYAIEIELNERAYEENKSNLDEYYNKKFQLISESAKAERAELERRKAKAETGSEKQEIDTALLNSIASEMEAYAKLDSFRKKENENIKRESDQLNIDLARAEGNSYAARMAEINQKYTKLIDDLKKQGRNADVEIAIKLRLQEESKVKADEIVKDVQKIIDAQQEKSAAISRARDKNGGWDSLVLDKAENASRDEGVSGLTAQRDRLLALKEAGNASAELQEQIKGVERSIDEMSIKIPTGFQEFSLNIKQTSREALESGLGDFFTDIATGAESVGDAARNMVTSFTSAISRMAAEALAKMAIFALFKALTGGAPTTPGFTEGGFNAGGLKSAIGAGVKQYHSGGIAGAGGTRRTVDPSAFLSAPRYHIGGIAGLAPGEVPAILEPGEEVLTRDNPRHIANGGGQQSTQGIKIINVYTREMAMEHLSSSDGERVQLNMIQRNASAIKNILNDS